MGADFFRQVVESLGDYAVFRLGKPDEVRVGGYFDERWKKP